MCVRVIRNTAKLLFTSRTPQLWCQTRTQGPHTHTHECTHARTHTHTHTHVSGSAKLPLHSSVFYIITYIFIFVIQSFIVLSKMHFSMFFFFFTNCCACLIKPHTKATARILHLTTSWVPQFNQALLKILTSAKKIWTDVFIGFFTTIQFCFCKSYSPTWRPVFSEESALFFKRTVCNFLYWHLPLH